MNPAVEEVQSRVIEETLALFCTNPHAGYQDYIDHLSWYWQLPRTYRRPWVGAWIRLLTTGLDFKEV